MSASNNQGERAADEVKGGIKGIHNLGENLRHNINSFADELVGQGKEHKSTGFSTDAKAAGAGTQAEVERVGQKMTGSHPNTAVTGENPTAHSTVGSGTHATGAPGTTGTGAGTHLSGATANNRTL